MIVQEWPLIVFTLLVQGSVGTTVLLSLILLFAGNSLDGAQRRRFLLAPLIVAVVAGGCGLIASTLHLGYPLNAFNALRHFSSSWLSREIIFASLYLAAVGIAAVLALFLRKVCLPMLLLGSVLGLIDVYCMGAIYTHTTIATWTHINTWFMFFGAVLSNGATAGIWLSAGLSDKLRRQVAASALAVIAVGALLRLLEQMSYFSYLTQAKLSQVVTFPHQPLAAFDQLRTLYIASWVLLLVGIALMGRSVRACKCRSMVVLGGCAVIAAEVLLRVVFFTLS